MKGFVSHLRAFWRDEEGQSTTEYILILAAVVLMARKFSGKLNDIITNLTGKLDQNVSDTMNELQ